MSPCPPPPPETLKPSPSEAFPAGGGWVWCPAQFPIEGLDATWFWNAEKRCFGISALSLRTYSGIGQVGVHAGLLPADSLNPETAARKLEELLHEYVSLMAME